MDQRPHLSRRYINTGFAGDCEPPAASFEVAQTLTGGRRSSRVRTDMSRNQIGECCRSSTHFLQLALIFLTVDANYVCLSRG